MLTPEQIKEFKDQLRKQVSHLPDERKKQAIQQIDLLSSHALEAMINQQRLEGKEEKTIFRMIINKDIQVYEVEESKESLAVLDINPISKGHILLIPKKAAADSNSLPSSIFNFAKKLAKRLESELKAKSVEIQTENKFNETIINIIPVYDKPLNINSPRMKSSKEELEEIVRYLKPKKKIEVIKIKREKLAGNQVQKISRRIP